MERVGILGLGRMGLPSARRLSRADIPVTAFDPDPERVRLGREFGLDIALDEQEVAALSDVLITILPGPAELREALLGPRGALEALVPGSCWLDLTSSDPHTASDIARAATDRGVGSVGAPTGGDPARAAAGILRFHVGGNEAAVARVSTLLGHLGEPRDLIRTGPGITSGYVTKLLPNTLWFGQVVAVTEVLLLGQALGLEPRALKESLASGAGGSAFLDTHLDALLDGDYLTSFGLPRIVEELETVSGLAELTGTPAELTALLARLHREALARFGPIDGELSAAMLLEERAGRTVRAARPNDERPPTP